MNKHIELVKKWLENPDSVTQEELETNSAAAANADRAADRAADAAYEAYVAIEATARAARAVANAANWAARDADWAAAKCEASDCVKEFGEMAKQCSS